MDKLMIVNPTSWFNNYHDNQLVSVIVNWLIAINFIMIINQHNQLYYDHSWSQMQEKRIIADPKWTTQGSFSYHMIPIPTASAPE